MNQKQNDLISGEQTINIALVSSFVRIYCGGLGYYFLIVTRICNRLYNSFSDIPLLLPKIEKISKRNIADIKVKRLPLNYYGVINNVT